MKHLILSLSVAAALAGCAGGSGVAKHDVAVTIPTLRAVDPSKILDVARDGSDNPIPYVSLHTGSGGRVQYSKLRYQDPNNPWENEENKFIYVTPDGRKYSFENGFTGPVFADHRGEQDTNVPNRHSPQPTDNGGKLFACCEEQNDDFTPSSLTATRYGAWISPLGQADLFVAGVPAKLGDMQGASSSHDGRPTGKATYTVWALRVRDGHVVSSSHNNEDRNIRSLITVNFNTGKVGGTIKGNADFGSDIHLNNVDVNGTSFSGSATSGGVNGQVEGRFFGKSNARYNSEIGGKITFDGNRSLDSVFAGRTASGSARNANDRSTDLTPLQ